ncbi:MAG TPA: hypothetical protein P5280_12385 [Cyclobacteriaceae bacterium]|nr:hypothetical protein [Cyclobacteriaceae bacterium]
MPKGNSLKILTLGVFRWIKKMYNEYREYVRTDLIMYGVWILLIILFFIYTMMAD